MAKVKGDILIDIEKCKGCELCVAACPQEALEASRKINAKGYHYIVKVEDTCTGCVNCALVCPEGVIKVYRKVNKKKKEHLATVTEVSKDINITVSE